jgi:hypothetical protein
VAFTDPKLFLNFAELTPILQRTANDAPAVT